MCVFPSLQVNEAEWQAAWGQVPAWAQETITRWVEEKVRRCLR